MGALLKSELEGLAERFPFIADVRGKGLLIGAELVADPRDAGAACRSTEATNQRLLDHRL